MYIFLNLLSFLLMTNSKMQTSFCKLAFFIGLICNLRLNSTKQEAFISDCVQCVDHNNSFNAVNFTVRFKDERSIVPF